MPLVLFTDLEQQDQKRASEVENFNQQYRKGKKSGPVTIPPNTSIDVPLWGTMYPVPATSCGDDMERARVVFVDLDTNLPDIQHDCAIDPTLVDDQTIIKLIAAIKTGVMPPPHDNLNIYLAKDKSRIIFHLLDPALHFLEGLQMATKTQDTDGQFCAAHYIDEKTFMVSYNNVDKKPGLFEYVLFVEKRINTSGGRVERTGIIVDPRLKGDGGP